MSDKGDSPAGKRLLTRAIITVAACSIGIVLAIVGIAYARQQNECLRWMDKMKGVGTSVRQCPSGLPQGSEPVSAVSMLNSCFGSVPSKLSAYAKQITIFPQGCTNNSAIRAVGPMLRSEFPIGKRLCTAARPVLFTDGHAELVTVQELRQWACSLPEDHGE